MFNSWFNLDLVGCQKKDRAVTLSLNLAWRLGKQGWKLLFLSLMMIAWQWVKEQQSRFSEFQVGIKPPDRHKHRSDARSSIHSYSIIYTLFSTLRISNISFPVSALNDSSDGSNFPVNGTFDVRKQIIHELKQLISFANKLQRLHRSAFCSVMNARSSSSIFSFQVCSDFHKLVNTM